MSKAKPPIVVFAFNRPNRLQQCLVSLESNFSAQEYEVYIFIDGPKFDNDATLVNKCREVAHSSWNFRDIQVINNEVNLGLSSSIKKGLAHVFEAHDAAIILEDDLTVHNLFLEFMTMSLFNFANDKRIASVQGFSLIERDDGFGYFLLGADCWGWATWRDRWTSVNWDSKSNLDAITASKKEREFNFENSYNFTKLLEMNSVGAIDSWAINWQASMFLQGRMSLYPPFNLVQNDGSGSKSTHTKNLSSRLTSISSKSEWRFPQEVGVKPEIYNSVVRSYSNFIERNRIIRRIGRKFKRIVQK